MFILRFFVIIIMALSILQACKKDFIPSQNPVNKTVIDPKLVYRVPETATEKDLVINLEKITEVVKEVYKNKEAIKEVNAAIQARVYTDESIMLRDLIFTDNGVLSNSDSFQKLKAKLSLVSGTFSAAFWKEVGKRNDAAFNIFLSTLGNYSTSMKNRSNPLVSTWQPIDVTLYYPYSYEYINPHDLSGNYSPQTSVMTATADADEGYGWAPIYDSNGNKVGGLEQSGTIGGSISFKSDDAIIRQQNHKWDVFFSLNRGIPGDPILNGWLIYDNNNHVSFTLADRKLVQ